jgi:hypothetical protein
LVVADRSRGVVGRASRGVVAEIDEKLSGLDRDLASYEGLLAERERLRAVRATLTGEEPPQVSQDDVAAYLQEHGRSPAGVVAGAFGVPVARVSTHFYRGKLAGRFVKYKDGWDLVERPAKDQATEKAK